ncbi:hypothetical protein SK128_025432 [Halocaridina rubra]|uniref:Uncharacterized protein n=1 Tax=Halocaridina rubra TaxID=373956 RepID=A0AAN8X0C6_HALRR
MFETAAVLKGVLQVLAGTVSTLKVDGSACWKALSEEMLATDVAYYLVKKGGAIHDVIWPQDPQTDLVRSDIIGPSVSW